MSLIPAPTAELIDERVPWLDAEIEATLASASPDLELYQWVRYHLGWLNEGLQPLSDSERRRHGGKRLRGVLTILACEAVGGSGPAAAAAGAAIELVHNFSLVHDDVEDNDESRRHRPTVWKLWGIPQAINTGSNMQALVDRALLRLTAHHDPERVVQALHATNQAVLLMTEGQYLDMAGEDASGISLERYFRMTGGKTAALLEGALRVGAMLGTREVERVEALARFGYSFGLAFQCRDDFLGIWGDPALTGKPVGSDLIQGKRSLPVVDALTAAPADTPEGERLRSALRERDVEGVLRSMQTLGTQQSVASRVQEHTEAALSALAQARPVSPYGDAIRDIAQYALGRQS